MFSFITEDDSVVSKGEFLFLLFSQKVICNLFSTVADNLIVKGSQVLGVEFRINDLLQGYPV
jgi:hypothetical protein